MIYEVRDYHYRADKFDAYRAWAEEAVPVLKDKLDIVGFWVDGGDEPEIRGSKPINSPIGSANVTWIIRWPDRKTRDEQLPVALASDEWQAVWAKHPDAGGYLQLSSRFMNAM